MEHCLGALFKKKLSAFIYSAMRDFPSANIFPSYIMLHMFPSAKNNDPRVSTHTMYIDFTAYGQYTSVDTPSSHAAPAWGDTGGPQTLASPSPYPPLAPILPPSSSPSSKVAAENPRAIVEEGHDQDLAASRPTRRARVSRAASSCGEGGTDPAAGGVHRCWWSFFSAIGAARRGQGRSRSEEEASETPFVEILHREADDKVFAERLGATTRCCSRSSSLV
jgi:hypothetical protein